MKKNNFKKEFFLVPIFILLLAYIVGDYFGFSLFPSKSTSAATKSQATATVNGNVQNVTTILSQRGYEPIVVQAGVPVKWTIKADKQSLNGCNGVIDIAAYGIQQKLKEGDNLIEFTPKEAGVVPYSCWMGMITSKITVVNDITDKAATPVAEDITSNTQQNIPSCCGGIN